MSLIELIAAIPCVNSRKLAQTIIREIEAKGYEVVKKEKK